MLTVLFLVEKLKGKSYLVSESAFSPRMENLHSKKTRNESNFGWLIRQMSINQKIGRQTFRRRFVSGPFFVSPSPPECYLQISGLRKPRRVFRLLTSELPTSDFRLQTSDLRLHTSDLRTPDF